MSVAELMPAALLSNGDYALVVEADGRGHASFGGRLLTPHLGRGTSLYAVDDTTGEVLPEASASGSPEGVRYRAQGRPGTFQLLSERSGLRIQTSVCVVPNRLAELRRYTVANTSDRARELTLTWVTEMAAGSEVTFAKEGERGLLAQRRAPGGQPVFWLHALAESPAELLSVETDGERLLGTDGRGGCPAGLAEPLSDETGGGARPVLGLRVRISIGAGEEHRFTLACCAATAREDAVQSGEALSSEQVIADAFLEAALDEQRTRRQLKLDQQEADRLHRVGAGILHGSLEQHGPEFSPDDEIVADAARVLGLDPAQPLVVCRVADPAETDVAEFMLRARTFWHRCGLPVQLLIVNDVEGPSADSLQQKLHELIELDEGPDDDILLRHADVVTPEDQAAVKRAAQFVLTKDRLGALRSAA